MATIGGDERAKVLVVDDEAAIRRLLRRFLTEKGFAVSEASGAREAVVLLRAEAIDLVLTDLNMPGGGGLEVLCAAPAAASKPAVILMTGAGTVESAVEALKDGAMDYLCKPLELDRVETVVRRALARRARLRAAAGSPGLERLRADILSNLSHELRAPLSVVMGNAALLRSARLGPLSPAQAAALDRIEDGASRLLGLVENLLDLAEAEPPKAPARGYRVFALLMEVAERLQRSAAGKDLSVTWEADGALLVAADRAELKKALLQLGENSVKFTAQGWIRLAAAAREDGSGVDITVEDSGIGIAPEELGLLFSEFSQADPSATRRYGGTGIGLALCKKRVERLGGAISVRSAADGAAFSIFLPGGPVARLKGSGPTP